MAYAVVDLKTGLLKMVQAGHPHPMLLRPNGEAEFVGEGGVPIGLLPDVPYEQFELQMDPGDRLLLYSDGFTEARLIDGEMLEEQGLVDLIDKTGSRQSGHEFLEDLYWALTQIMSPQYGLEDDVSATLFEYNG